MAAKKKTSKRRYSAAASEEVVTELHELKLGLSKARRAGMKVPKRRTSRKK
jgi:hypothetical protein